MTEYPKVLYRGDIVDDSFFHSSFNDKSLESLTVDGETQELWARSQGYVSVSELFIPNELPKAIVSQSEPEVIKPEVAEEAKPIKRRGRPPKKVD